jgi:hypothetical protein
MVTATPTPIWIPIVVILFFLLLTLRAVSVEKARERMSLDERRHLRDAEDWILNDEAEQEEEAEK